MVFNQKSKKYNLFVSIKKQNAMIITFCCLNICTYCSIMTILWSLPIGNEICNYEQATSRQQISCSGPTTQKMVCQEGHPA